jgi:hypothetical protein
MDAPQSVCVNAPPTHCPYCKAEYVNVQHPNKPAGVSIMRTCDCKVSVVQVGPNQTAMILEPPPAKP